MKSFEVHTIVNFVEDGRHFMDIVFYDGTQMRFSMDHKHVEMTLNKLDPNVASLIREYAHGSIRYEHLLDSMGVRRPNSTIDELVDEIAHTLHRAEKRRNDATEVVFDKSEDCLYVHCGDQVDRFVLRETTQFTLRELEWGAGGKSVFDYQVPVDYNMRVKRGSARKTDNEGNQ